MMKVLSRIAVFTLLLISTQAWAQSERDERATIEKFKGLQFKSADSTFYINFRFRMQNRLGLTTESGNDLSVEEFEARVRRLRLRIDGFLYDPKLTYSVQLSFSRGDQDLENTGVANIIRDAVIFYHFTPKFYMAFGVSKLPGNRQRVNSSGQLQFAERSIVNGALTIDRDFGLKTYYTEQIGKVIFNLKTAISTGEGRSANTTDDGLAYTGRVEVLPFGAFTGGGDYSEGDLEREKTLKLSLAGGYSFNHKAKRTGGQLGQELYNEVNLGTWILDGLIKYNGWAYTAEFLKRDAPNPLTYDSNADLRYAFVGMGINHQLSYLFKNNYELAGRYSFLKPSQKIIALEPRREVLELGTSKYLQKHRIKLQLSLNYQTQNGDYKFSNQANRWGVITQIELGI